MAEPPEQQNRDPYARAEPARQSSTGTPRWVKVFGIVLAVVVLLLAVVFLVGGGNHGPSRHSAPASVVEYGAHLEYGANQG